MRSRGYNKRIEIWSISLTADSFGGNLVTESLLSNSWANIKTLDSRSGLVTDFGLLDASTSLVITMRKRNDLVYDIQTMFIKYRNEKYIIKSFPINKDFEDNSISIVCVKESNLASGNDLNSNI